MPPFNAIITGESTLSLSRTELLVSMGIKAFGSDYGANPNSWVAADTAKINIALGSGLRQFYGAYDWSFLRPMFTAKLTVGEAVYDLPDDFAGAADAIAYTSDWSGYSPIVWSDLIDVERDLARTSGNSAPTKFAIEALPHSGESQGQRYAIHFNARAAAEYQLRGQYRVNPYLLSSNRPYPLGGAEYAECLKHACLAAWESEFEDNPNGPSNVVFQRLLPQCIKTNQRRSPKQIGMNGTKRLVPVADGPPIFTGDIRYGGSSVFGG